MSSLPNKLLAAFIFTLSSSFLSYSLAADKNTWRTPDADNLMVMELENGEVLIELAPQFAPNHVANIKKLIAQGYFDGLGVIRSHDNYVAQWGDHNFDNDKRRSIGDAEAELAPEFFRNIEDINYTPIVSKDAYADEVGFADGFPVASDKKRVWMTHCYGAVGVGRGMEPNSGNGSGLYVVTGHAPRHLDLNVTLVGRVLKGIEHLSSLPRGTGALGFYESEEEHMPIKNVTLASTSPTKEPKISVMRTDSAAFAEHVANRTTRTNEWFLNPTGKIELCNVGVPSKNS